MKTKKGLKPGLTAILFFYGLLYLATTKIPPCDSAICQKMEQLNNLLRNNRSYVYGAGECRDSVICISVNDTTQRDWNALADTACSYLNSQSLIHYTTVIINIRQDTLARKQCP